MTKEEIENGVKEQYPIYIETLLKIEKDLVSILDSYKNDNPDLIKDGDFRPGLIGRLLASLVSSRFLFNQTLEFINTENWDESFQEKYVHSPWENLEYYGHFKGIDLGLRFHLFHSIYHNIETTFRLICINLGLRGKKPINLINDLTALFPIEFIELIDAVRNTIHNNGYYQPIGKQSKKIEYSDEFMKFEFNENEAIEINTTEVLKIIENYIGYIKNLLKSEVLSGIPIIKDKS
jgi:hypothetical protein